MAKKIWSIFLRKENCRRKEKTRIKFRKEAERITREKSSSAYEKAAAAAANARMSQRGGGAGDSSRSHMGGISQAQADAVGAANAAAGYGGWGL